MSPLAGVELDRSVLIFAVAISGVTGFLFGVVPSLLATGDPGRRLRAGGRGGGGAGPSRALVVSQVAISVTLVVGAGLLVKSLWSLRSLELGFRPAGVVEASVDPAAQGHDDVRRAALLVATAVVACRVPAVRATQVDPVEALTEE